MNRVSLSLFLALAGLALAVALAINYAHAVEAYRAAGFPGWQALAAGLVPDIVIAAASTLIVGDARAGRGWRPLPVTLLALGGLLSLGVNGWLAAGSPSHQWITVVLYVSPTLVVLAIAPLIEEAVSGVISPDAPEIEGTESTETADLDWTRHVTLGGGVEPSEGHTAPIPRIMASGEVGDVPEVPWTREYARLWAESFRLERGRLPFPSEMAGPAQRDRSWCKDTMRPLRGVPARA